MNDLAIIGLGYIGLPTAALCAQAGMKVLGFDINPRVIESVNAGIPHLEEPGLAEILAPVVRSDMLRASAQLEPARIFMIAVPTPVDHQTHRPDMSLVRAAAQSVAGVAMPGALIILQSTSPVGSTERDVRNVIEALRPDLKDKLAYVYCPERAIPGKTIQEMVENDRAVGGLSMEATQRAVAFYQRFVKGKLLHTDARTAEMVKLVENASRDVQIAFANELSLVCDHLGLNVWQVIEMANLHPRVNILKPGPGVGGHCIAVDPWFIIDAAPMQSPLMRTARQVNDRKPEWVIRKVMEAARGIKNPTICALGLAYKENVDDFRESPSVEIVERLQKMRGVQVVVVEPFMQSSDRYHLVSLEEGLARAQIVLHLTPHAQFKAISAQALRDKIVIDTRGDSLGALAA